LVDNGCNIWNGDAYKNYLKKYEQDKTSGIVYYTEPLSYRPYWQEEFINKIKTDDEFAKKWGELGPIYGNQWRKWNGVIKKSISGTKLFSTGFTQIDQIQNLINDLKTNPDSRRLIVNAWNVGELDQMVLPPCHYGFQVYTRELSLDERNDLLYKKIGGEHKRENCFSDEEFERETLQDCKAFNIPTRAISLMWNQRSCDFPLGIPFNIASYGLLLEIIAKEVNMVPDELIGNLGDCHIYLNQIEGCKEQIGRKYTHEERTELLKQEMGEEKYNKAVDELMPFGGGLSEYYDSYKIPYMTREPYELPRLKFSPCPITGIDMEYQSIAQFQIENYESHPTIKSPLSN
jgi:thymidylate synthase